MAKTIFFEKTIKEVVLAREIDQKQIKETEQKFQDQTKMMDVASKVKEEKNELFSN